MEKQRGSQRIYGQTSVLLLNHRDREAQRFTESLVAFLPSYLRASLSLGASVVLKKLTTKPAIKM
jgi:hypothetical protein